MKHINIQIKGLVQGVFFRVSAKDQALKLNLKGFARNELDGSVYIEVEGSAEALEKFISWCKNGPGGARVDEVVKEEAEVKNFSGFDIY